MTPEERVEAIRRVVRDEERNRVVGMVEFYRATLGDTKEERTVSHLLDVLIKTLEHNV